MPHAFTSVFSPFATVLVSWSRTVELVDLLLELCLPVVTSLSVFGLYSGEVGFRGGDETEYGSSSRGTGQSWIGNSEEFDQVDATGDPKCTVAGFRNSCVVPLAGRDRIMGILTVGKHEDTA